MYDFNVKLSNPKSTRVCMWLINRELHFKLFSKLISKLAVIGDIDFSHNFDLPNLVWYYSVCCVICGLKFYLQTFIISADQLLL